MTETPPAPSSSGNDVGHHESIGIVRRLAAENRGPASASKQPSGQELEQLDADHRRAITDDLRADTQLKRNYAKWFIWILIGQLVAMNAVFASVGIGTFRFEEYVLHLYMGGTLAEVFGIVLIITRYLFSKR